ncbi:hypothetical protein CYLTODRAFT_397584 [Cylindrobasidium torrendii FP15055 ss-10]|uniref:Uncharacterized protein n=1 Tax=Cylindrobasidium torrendii FP15055 ss-10 TaxID=1314674 RepID=A0A0D7B9I7_9AGAR|nr:hypothetical protein CYLTODRAFT_397584 [Cylindrobasidium torrendii FP15055 ss-10]
MASNIAKKHTNTSNRAQTQPKQNQNQKEKASKDVKGAEKKVVYKSVMDNPFRISWPSVPVNAQNVVLAKLVSALEPITEYQTTSPKSEKRKARPRPKAKATADPIHVDDPPVESTPVEESNKASTSQHEDLPVTQGPPPPELKSHIVVGINAVTKRLESQIQHARKRVVVSADNSDPPPPPSPPADLKWIFVCVADVDPPILISHIPHLVASFNTAKPREPIKLVPLPKGAEETISASLGIRRATILAFDDTVHELAELDALLISVPLLAAAWLTPASSTIVPTHIKQVCTTAPKDVRRAKEDRAEGRTAAKKRKLSGGEERRAKVPKT